MKPSQERLRRAAMIFRMALVAVVASLGASTGHAQQSKGPPNALQGFSSNRGTPVRIQAVALEVRDKDKQAVFSGNVQVVQGDTTLKSKTLIVFYEGDAANAGGPVAQGKKGEGQQQMRRMEAKGGVTVKQKDQVATGDTADYDVRANTITLNGNVVVTRGQDVLKGSRLVVDLTTSVSKFESAPGQRIDMMITPRQQDGNSGSGSTLGPTLGPPTRPAR
jgi:lipopolysaccharide export system protein LptA